MQGRTQGGGGGVQVNPPFFKLIIFIAWFGMHANSYCYPRYLFKVQIFIKIATKYTETEINIGRIECASLLFQ